jgi:V-type H+-transporting ATPase subunit d
MDELISKCHPLGYFPTLAAVSLAGTSEGKLLPGSTQGIDNMFKEIMLETPLAVYFSSNFVTGDLREKDIEEIKAKLYASYLHSFHSFCMQLGGVTAELMGPILQFEADRRAINITFNSLQTELNKDDRVGMFPSIGFLVPEGHLKLRNAEDDEAVKRAISHIQIYKTIMEKHESNSQKNLEDFFWEQEVEMCKRVFDQQFHYGVFYAFVKLREQVSRLVMQCCCSILKNYRCYVHSPELAVLFIPQSMLFSYYAGFQEVRNIVWIAECITQGQKDRINDYVPIF